MKKKILLLEYLNYVDANNRCIGHGKKALSEALELLSDDFDVTIASSKAYMPEESNRFDYIELPECKENKKKKVIYRQIINNFISIKETKNELIWLTNVEWFGLSLIPALFRSKKVIATVYRDYVNDILQTDSKFKNIKAKSVRKGLDAAKLIISTQINSNISSHQIHLPDYFYDEDKYSKYKSTIKKNVILCVGSMRRSKDLVGLVKHFNYTNIPLYIIGEFVDENFYLEVKNKVKTGNIILENRKLSEEEYYTKIGEAKFVILPYVMDQYSTATSGILQESIFLGAIPIAPKVLLENNNIKGIGYSKLEDLPILSKDINSISNSINNNLKFYNKKTVKKNLEDSLNKL